MYIGQYERKMRLLFVRYSSAFQIWDCTDQKGLPKFLNVDCYSQDVAIMPKSLRKGSFRRDRPPLIFCKSSILVVTNNVLNAGLGRTGWARSCVFVSHSLSRCEVVRHA